MHPTRIIRFAFFCAAAAFVNLSPTALADGLIVPRPIPGPRPQPQIPPYVKFHRVKVDVRGRIATTSVDQVFVNPNRRAMEGEYVFPIPEGCAISNFTLDIDGVQVDAELLDAQKARRIYEDIVRRQKDPALLEYVDRGMFRARIFPIAPGGTRRITLSYDEEVKRHGTLFTYRYPLNTEKFSSRPIEETRVDMQIRSDRPVRSVVCSSHAGDAKVRQQRDGVTEVNLLERGTKPDRDFVVYYGLGGDLSVDVVAHRKQGDDGYFMLAISPPTDERAFQNRPKDIAFVVDTSGSMAGPKIEQVKNALKYCLNSLSPQDRFTVIRFSTDAEAYANELVGASRDAVARAVSFVDRFRARGGTAIQDAMTLAFQATQSRLDASRPLMVAFLTDGLPTIGERDPERLSKLVADRMPKDARVFVFGVGNNLNTKLLDRMAEMGNGSRTYVAPEEDVEIAVSGFYDRIASPVLTDLKLEFDPSLQVRDVYPRKLGDLFRGDEIVVYGRYRGSFGSHAIWLRGKSERREERFVFEPGFPGEQPDNAFISRLWATRKIGYLLDEIRLRGESAELKDEVVRLSREFGILTPYTSMLVLEDEADLEGGRRGRNMPLPATRLRDAAQAPGAEEERAMKGHLQLGADAVNASKASEAMKKEIGIGANDMLAGLKADARDKVKHLEDKTFYLNGGVWWDSTVDAKAERTTVTFMSDEYFELVRKQPKLGAYFALGEKVVVAFGGTVYEVKP
jgi:Ca-activated chloride channel family protein